MTAKRKLTNALIFYAQLKPITKWLWPYLSNNRALALRLKILKKRLNHIKSENLQYNTLGQWVDGAIVPPSDGPMFILIDWE